MGNYRLGVLASDGIGHEIVSATVDVFRLAVQKLEMNIDWIKLPIGHNWIKLHNHPIPEETKDSLLSCNGWIIGPRESTSYPQEYQSIRNPVVSFLIPSIIMLIYGQLKRYLVLRVW
jgi:3-isopropylmalate dehydrogenase